MKNQEETAARLFGEALNLRPDERPAFLDRACDGQSVLRGRVEALLKENDGSHGFLTESPLIRLKNNLGNRRSRAATVWAATPLCGCWGMAAWGWSTKRMTGTGTSTSRSKRCST